MSAVARGLAAARPNPTLPVPSGVRSAPGAEPPPVPVAFLQALVPPEGGRTTSVRDLGDGWPPVCMAPYDDAIVGPPVVPPGIVVAGGATDVRVDVDELSTLATSFRELVDALAVAAEQERSAVTDVAGLEDRLDLALRTAGSASADPGAWDACTAARHELLARAADVTEALTLVGRGLARAADEAGRLVDGLEGARETYARAEVEARPRGAAFEVRRLASFVPFVGAMTAGTRVLGAGVGLARNGVERTDLATPLLEAGTDLRAALYPLELAGSRFTWAPPRPLTRAGTADALTRTVDTVVSEPLTMLWTGAPRRALPAPVMERRPTPASVRRGRTTAQVLRTLDDINADAPDGSVGVQRTVRADGSSSWVVYVPGTEGSPNPLHKGFAVADHARTWAGNTGVLLGKDEPAVQAVEGAMADAGVRDDEKVVFVGHSQGGIIATLLAARRGTGGVATVGSPVGGIALPRTVEAVHVEVEGDEIHELDGQSNPATPTRTTVTLRPDEAAGTPYEPASSMHASINGARVAEALDGTPVTAALDAVLDDVAGPATSPLAESVRGPVSIYVPRSSGG